MKKQRQDGILILEDILSTLEEILILSKISKNPKEKDIHREIREAFQLKTKTELLIANISTLYRILIEIETEQEASILWKGATNPSPQIKQKAQNRKDLLAYLENIPPELEPEPKLEPE